MKRLSILLGAITAAVFLLAFSLTGRSVSAQASVPDLSQFGYPQVIGTVNYTPGQTATISAGDQQVVLPSDFISKTVKFELLQGDPGSFSASLPITDQGRTILVAWAFRVTDSTSNQLIARFDKPVQWSFTNAAVVPGSAVYNTTAANPPVVSANAAPGTITGTTISHPFGGAGVGWLVLAPAAVQPAATAVATAVPTTVPTEAVPTAAPTAAPTEVPLPTAVPVAVGMPNTGNPGSAAALGLAAVLALFATGLGLLVRGRRTS